MVPFFSQNSLLDKVHRDQRGLETMEYLLVAAFVLSASVATYSVLSSNVQTASTNMADDVHAALNGGGGSGSGGSTSTTTDPGGGGIDAGDLGDPTGGVDPTGGIDPIGGIDPTGGTEPVGGVDPTDLGDSVDVGDLNYPELPATHPLNNWDPGNYIDPASGTGATGGNGGNGGADEGKGWWETLKELYWDGWKEHIERRPRKEWLKLLTNPDFYRNLTHLGSNIERWLGGNNRIWTLGTRVREWLGNKGFFRFLDKWKGRVRGFCDFLGIVEVSMLMGELIAAFKDGNAERIHLAGEGLFQYVFREILFGKLEKIGGGKGMKWVKDWLPPVYFVMTEVLKPLLSVSYDGLAMIGHAVGGTVGTLVGMITGDYVPESWGDFFDTAGLGEIPDYMTDSLPSWLDFSDSLSDVFLALDVDQKIDALSDMSIFDPQTGLAAQNPLFWLLPTETNPWMEGNQ